jgi:hypothetical protein
MAITRIEFTDSDETNSYSVPINPHIMDIVDSDEYSLIETLDGYSVKSNSTVDSRIRRLVWPAYRDTDSTFLAMLSELASYIGENKRLHLHDIDYRSLGWKNIYVIDVTTNTEQGGPVDIGIELLYRYR